GRFAQMQITGLEIKPERPCFDDLLEPQTGVESAEKDETQLLSGRFSNQPVAKVVRAKILAGTSNGPRYLHILHRIATGDSSGLGVKRSAGFDVNVISHRFGSAHSLSRIGRFKCNEVALAVALNSKPINVAAKIQAATKFVFVSSTHLKGLSHTYCHTFKEKI